MDTLVLPLTSCEADVDFLIFCEKSQLWLLSQEFLLLAEVKPPDLLQTSVQRSVERSNPMSIISRARSVLNPFQELGLPSTLPYASLANLELRHAAGQTLQEVESTWMLESVETSLSHLYNSSLMKWDRQAKRREMHHPHQRFLIVSHKELGPRVAFLSFRWDLEENHPIMYVYELFVEAHARKQQIAVALMKYAEDLCRKQHIHKIMLTAFSDNQAAMHLYRQRLGYEIDDDSPSKCGIEDVGYEILSKQLLSPDGSWNR